MSAGYLKKKQLKTKQNIFTTTWVDLGMFLVFGFHHMFYPWVLLAFVSKDFAF